MGTEMLSLEEKAYCRALESLRKKDYITADRELETCQALFADSRGMQIISQATRLLAYIQSEKQTNESKKQSIKETIDNGEETVICGQGQQEETS